MSDRMRLTRDDLYSSSVDELLSEQQALRQGSLSVASTPRWRRIVFSSLFFLSIAGGMGGLLGWLIMEPLMNESVEIAGRIEFTEMIMGGDTQTWRVVVQGQDVFVSSDVTSVVGRGQWENCTSVSDLEMGQPAQITAMVVDEADALTMIGLRVVIDHIPSDSAARKVPDLEAVSRSSMFGGLFCFAAVGACIAGCIAAADALISRNIGRGLYCAAAGIGIAGVGGMLALIPSGIVFRVTGLLIYLVEDGMWTSGTIDGPGLLILSVGRSLTWGILGVCVGLGQGVALRSKQLVYNGLFGGILGGLAGGALFDPVDQFFTALGFCGEAWASRGVGFVLIGVITGGMIGLVEYFSKDAWLLMRGGPLAGKEFILHKSPTLLGSSPKCDIYIFKDPEVDARHAQIRKVGNRHEMQDLGSASGTRVNGQQVERLILQDGDIIVIGETILEYSGRAVS